VWPCAPDDGLRVGLAGGGAVLLRPFHPGDRPAVRAFLEGLSPESRRLRFFAPQPLVADRLVRDLVLVDQVGHVAWGAFDGGRCVAEARVVRHRRDRSVVEVAFAVAEHHRRQGLAAALVEVLGLVAAMRGVLEIEASVMPENRASRRLLASFGMTFRFEDGVSVGRMPVPSWSRSSREAHQVIALQAAAEASVFSSVA
jgi:RimJ/RimL family protein N-acetyltransferase